MKEFTGKITIVGVGQMGTSLVMAILQNHPKAKIIAQDIDPKIERDFWIALNEHNFGEQARKQVLFTTDPSQAMGSRIVFLCTPVSEFGNATKAPTPYLDKTTIVSDIGSVKEESIRRIEENLPKGIAYVPAHIFNGNAGTGPLTSKKDMFKGKPLFQVPCRFKEQERMITAF